MVYLYFLTLMYINFKYKIMKNCIFTFVALLVFGITNAMILYPVVKLFNILQDKNEIIQENISFFNKNY